MGARPAVVEPPTRLVLAFDIDRTWRHFDPDLETRVEVQFISDGPDRTLVEFEHRVLQGSGDAQDQMRFAVSSPVASIAS